MHQYHFCKHHHWLFIAQYKLVFCDCDNHSYDLVHCNNLHRYPFVFKQQHSNNTTYTLSMFHGSLMVTMKIQLISVSTYAIGTLIAFRFPRAYENAVGVLYLGGVCGCTTSELRINLEAFHKLSHGCRVFVCILSRLKGGFLNHFRSFPGHFYAGTIKICVPYRIRKGAPAFCQWKTRWTYARTGWWSYVLFS